MKKTYVRFHVGRGGRFNNPGYKTFVGFETIQDVMQGSDTTHYEDTDENGTPLAPADCKIYDNGTLLFEGQEAYDIINGIQEHGVAEYDGEYNTDIVRTLEDLHDDELDILGKMIIANDYLPWCDRKDDVVKYIAANSEAVFQKYNNAVATFNADAFCVETDDEIADVALSAYNDQLEELYEEDEEEWETALARLDLDSADRIYQNRDMLIAFDGDF